MKGTYKLATETQASLLKECQNALVAWNIFRNVTDKFLWADQRDIFSNEKEGRHLMELITNQEFMGAADVMTKY